MDIVTNLVIFNRGTEKIKNAIKNIKNKTVLIENLWEIRIFFILG